MPDKDDSKPGGNPGYALGQLLRAVRSQALDRVRRWEQVFQGMLDGSISVGSRAPLQDIPAWVTLEVTQGGFATGNLCAAGPLQSREIAAGGRAALNIYYVSEEGQRELCEMLRTGCYRIDVPEERRC